MSALLVGACLVATAATTSSAWVVGYGTRTRAAVLALHGGRVAVIYHAPSFLKQGPIVGSEPTAGAARDFLVPYAATGRRSIVSVPLYLPLVGFAALTWRRRNRPRRRGFPVAPANWATGGAAARDRM